LTNEASSVLVHKTIGHYSAPAEFGLFNGGDRMSTNQNDLPDAKMLAAKTYEHALYCFERRLTGDAVLMFGDDFSHPKAQKSYERMDEIIKILRNDHPEINV
jgi:hypothetical protein